MADGTVNCSWSMAILHADYKTAESKKL